LGGRARGNSASQPTDKRLMVLRPVSDPRVATRGGAPLFGIDANCHETLSQVGLPLRAIWHNEDYAFWLDADDLLDPPQRIQLQALLDGLRPGDGAAYVVRCSCDPGPNGDGGQTVVDHIRLFPVREGVRWTYAVHEQILPALRRANVSVRWTDLTVRHTGYTDPALRERKLQRDCKILEAELAERPENSGQWPVVSGQ